MSTENNGQQRKVLVWANQKGGVGKTSGCVNVAYEMATGRKKKVLVIDLDETGNATGYLGGKKSGEALVTYLADLQDNPGETTGSLPVEQTKFPGIDLVAGGPKLKRAERILRDMSAAGGQYLLWEGLAATQGQWEYVFVDTGPNTGLLTISGFVLGGGVPEHVGRNHNWGGIIATTTTQPMGVEGVGDLVRSVRGLQRVSPGLKIRGILPSNAKAETRSHKRLMGDLAEIANLIAESQEAPCTVGPPIRTNVKVAESYEEEIPVAMYAPASRGTKCYEEATAWLVKLVRASQKGS